MAQKKPAEPSRFLTRFNFAQLTGGVILLQGRFDNFSDTLSFILDTGSGGISLDSSTAEYFGLKGNEARSIAAEVGMIVSAWRKSAEKIGLGRAEIDRMPSAFEHDGLKKALAGNA